LTATNRMHAEFHVFWSRRVRDKRKNPTVMPLLASTYRNGFTCSSDHFQYLAQSSGSIKSFRGESTLPNGDTVAVGQSFISGFSFSGFETGFRLTPATIVFLCDIGTETSIELGVGAALRRGGDELLFF
jgi:hypothetical protein